MDQREAIEFVVRVLGEDHQQNDVIDALCQRTGWPRHQVEYFVSKVEIEQQEAIEFTRRAIQEEQAAPEPSATTSGLGGPPKPGFIVSKEARREASEFIVRELSDGKSQADIIHALCEHYSWPWNQAQRFARRVEIEHYDQIASSQRKPVIVVGLLTIVFGLGITLTMLFITLNGTSLYIMRNFVWLPFVGMIPYIENIIFLITGLGMFLGGLASIWQTFIQWLELRRESD